MIRLYFWLPDRTQVGHCALWVSAEKGDDTTYISWWPKVSVNRLKQAPGTEHSLADDEMAEGRKADITIELNDDASNAVLDEPAVLEWWENFKKKNYRYELAGMNCSWVVIKALRSSGSDKFFPWYRFHVKKNIPLKSVTTPIAVPVATSVFFMNPIFMIPMVVRITAALQQSVMRSLRARRLSGELPAKIRRASLKLVLVDVIDGLSHIWSPLDALRYCKLLDAQIRRKARGDGLVARLKEA